MISPIEKHIRFLTQLKEFLIKYDKGNATFNHTRDMIHETIIVMDKLQDYLSKFSGSEDDIENCDVLSTDKERVASTVSIFDFMVNRMASNEDLKTMCYSVIYPAVYERLPVPGNDMNSIRDLILLKLPADVDAIISDGRKFLLSIYDKSVYHMTNPKSWDQFSPEVSEWVRTLFLPYVYDSQDLSFDGESWSLEKMSEWNNRFELRGQISPVVDDSLTYFQTYRDKVMRLNGIDDWHLLSMGMNSM